MPILTRFHRVDGLSGLLLSAVIGLVVVAAISAGMASTGLHGGIELVASLLFFLTLPAGVLAALCGRLAMPLGLETAFLVTSVVWVVLSFAYGALVARVVRRAINRYPQTANG